MNEYMSVRNQFCPNPHCSKHRKEAMGNVAVHSRKLRRLRCTECRKTWVQYRNDPAYGLRSDLVTVKSALDFISNGMSVRSTAKKLSLSPSTIQRWKHKFKNL